MVWRRQSLRIEAGIKSPLNTLIEGSMLTDNTASAHEDNEPSQSGYRLNASSIGICQNISPHNKDIAAHVDCDATTSVIQGTCNNKVITCDVNLANFKNYLRGFITPSQALPHKLDYCSFPTGPLLDKQSGLEGPADNSLAACDHSYHISKQTSVLSWYCLFCLPVPLCSWLRILLGMSHLFHQLIHCSLPRLVTV